MIKSESVYAIKPAVFSEAMIGIKPQLKIEPVDDINPY